DALGNRKPVTSAEHNRNTEVITTNGAFAITVRNMLPGIGSIGEFQVTPPQLADPELLEIERNNPLPTPGSDEERKLFSAAVVADMFWTLPGLRSLVGEILGLDDAAQDWRATGVPWDLVPAEARPILRDYYHEYLLRKQNQRFVVVDTNSVVLNLFTGTESALETFKRAHRYLDVLKAEVDLERRKALLSKGILDDPEIETMVRVNGMESVLPTP
ncbi:MAG TPA: hypothetical protein VM869_12260, partial [Enhygromyxa sp.]|nr:hypothetical protein [Enhygromyxa sp.]